jgi:hypothetical protein
MRRSVPNLPGAEVDRSFLPMRFTINLRTLLRSVILSFTSIFVLQAEVAWADIFDTEPSHDAREVEFFAGIAAGDVEAVMIPRDARRATIQIKNNTDRPLAVRLPHAFAGVPVLAQIGAFPPPGGAAPQALGMGFPGGGGNPGGGLFGAPGGVMNIAPGKVIKVKRASVCLEYSKPEPGPRIPYQIVPLEKITDDAAVRELLTVLAHDELDQRVAQVVVWHFANDMSWEQLAGLSIKHINGRRSLRFTAAEIRAAQQLTAALPSQQRNDSRDTKRDSLSRR